MEKKTIGAFIAALRKVNGITQKELAEKLNVSDKAVSRWERDECAPDITLIPVIADIFGVASDEILRGERSNNEYVSSSSDDKTKNEEKKSRLQLSNLINSVNSKFLIQSIISVGINIVFWLIFIILDSVIEVAFSTSSELWISIIGTMIPVIIEIIFFISFLSSVKCYESESNEILRCRNRNILIFEFTIGLITVVNSFMISYSPISLAFIIGMVVLHLIFRSCSLYVPLDKKHNVKDSAKTRLKSITVILLILILIFSSLLISFSDNIAVKTYSPECKEFTYSEFVGYLNEKGCKAELDPKIEITDDFTYVPQHIELFANDGFFSIGVGIGYSNHPYLNCIAVNEAADDNNSIITLNEGLYRIDDPIEDTFYYVIIDTSGTVRVKFDEPIEFFDDLIWGVNVSIVNDKSLEAEIYNLDDARKICDIIVDITVVLSFVTIVAIIVIYVIKTKKISKKA